MPEVPQRYQRQTVKARPFTGQTKKPALGWTHEDIAKQAAQILSPQSSGQLRITGRSSRYDPASHSWQPDSSWSRWEYEFLPIFGEVTLKDLRSSSYSYARADSVHKSDTDVDASYFNADSANRSYDYVGGQWRCVYVDHRRPGQTPYYEWTESYNDTIGRLQVMSLSRGHTFRDPQNRITVQIDTSFGRYQGRSIYIDSNWYQGADTYPRRNRFYSSPQPNAPASKLVFEMDSVVERTQPYFSESVYRDYLDDGRLWRRSYSRQEQVGDSLISTGTSLFYGFPPDTNEYSYYRGVEFHSGDTVKSHGYFTYQGQTAWSRDYALTRRGYSENKYEVFTPRGWVVSQWYKNEALLAPNGTPRRSIGYQYDTTARTFIPTSKFDYEFYSPEIASTDGQATGVLTLSPNPAGQYLTVRAAFAVTHLILTNTVGQQYTVSVESGRASIAHLPPGLYHAAAFSEGKLLDTSRVVKE